MSRQLSLQSLKLRLLDHLWVFNFVVRESPITLLGGVYVYFLSFIPNKICKFKLWSKWMTKYPQGKSRFSTLFTIFWVLLDLDFRVIIFYYFCLLGCFQEGNFVHYLLFFCFFFFNDAVGVNTLGLSIAWKRTFCLIIKFGQPFIGPFFFCYHFLPTTNTHTHNHTDTHILTPLKGDIFFYFLNFAFRKKV